MLEAPRCPVVTLEEHYWDDELVSHYTGLDARGSPELIAGLRDVGAGRIRAMDEAGIDLQVLSHAAPATQQLRANIAPALTARANDRLHAIVAVNSARLAAFAALPTAVPQAAAAELERCVRELGFVGAMLHGPTDGAFIDDKRFWPIFAMAEALDVPIYLHPSIPVQPVIDAYYKEYAQDFPMILRAAWGFGVETATLAVRLVLSGVFDAHPGLKIILGHLGEGLPFLLWRIDHALSRPGQKPVRFRETFARHFYVTTSGFFSDTALRCCIEELGVDRIMFSVDYPFEANMPGTRWLAGIPLCDEDKAKIASGNAARLLRLKLRTA
jgi:2,3-dihydroxybenzoate decarboxylase